MQADPFDKAQDRPFDSPFDKLKASLPETSSGQAGQAGQVNSDVRPQERKNSVSIAHYTRF